MALAAILASVSHLPVDQPPQLWTPEAAEETIRELARAILNLLPPTTPASLQPRWILSNLVVPLAAGLEGAAWPTPGEYLGLTLTAQGTWTTDWRWPGQVLPIGLEQPARAAAVAFAYGRALTGAASLTVALPRRPGLPA